MRIDILTVLPQLLESPFAASIMKRAQDKGHVEIHVHNIRDYSTDKHKNVDDYQYGGGAGMVMSIEPIAALIDKLNAAKYKLKLHKQLHFPELLNQPKRDYIPYQMLADKFEVFENYLND